MTRAVKVAIGFAVLTQLVSLAGVAIIAARGENTRGKTVDNTEINGQLICAIGGFTGGPVRRENESDRSFADRRESYQAFRALLATQPNCDEAVRRLSSQLVKGRIASPMPDVTVTRSKSQKPSSGTTDAQDPSASPERPDTPGGAPVNPPSTTTPGGGGGAGGQGTGQGSGQGAQGVDEIVGGVGQIVNGAGNAVNGVGNTVNGVGCSLAPQNCP